MNRTAGSACDLEQADWPLVILRVRALPQFFSCRGLENGHAVKVQVFHFVPIKQPLVIMRFTARSMRPETTTHRQFVPR